MAPGRGGGGGCRQGPPPHPLRSTRPGPPGKGGSCFWRLRKHWDIIGQGRWGRARANCGSMRGGGPPAPGSARAPSGDGACPRGPPEEGSGGQAPWQGPVGFWASQLGSAPQDRSWRGDAGLCRLPPALSAGLPLALAHSPETGVLEMWGGGWKWLVLVK